VLHSPLHMGKARSTQLLVEVAVRKPLAALLGALVLVAAPPLGFGWGREALEKGFSLPVALANRD